MTYSKLASALACGVCIVAMATPASAQTRTYNIAAGSLKSALDAYGRQSGRPVIYQADQIRGLQSRGASGSMSADAALEAVLAGTPFRGQADSSGAIAIVRVGNGTADADQASSTEEDAQAITVTGTRIKNAAPISPSVQIDRDTIERTGLTTVNEVLSTVPQNVSGSLQVQNAGAFGPNILTNTGFAAGVDLRGFGDATLILIDGIRLPKSGINATSDISVVPLPLVQRIDVLTDGASALYGSDAVGGVVNFILRDDFKGVEGTAAIGVPTRGQGVHQNYNLTAGIPWDGGGLAFGYTHDRQEAIKASDRDFAFGAGISDIVPPSRSDNGAIFLHQWLSSTLKISAQAIYNKRQASRLNDFGAGFLYNERSKAEEYLFGTRVDYDLSSTWSASLTASLSKSNESYTTLLSFSDPAEFALSSISKESNSERAIEFQLSGTVLDLPGGPLKAAFGGGYRRERFTFDFPLGLPAAASADVSRGNSFAFGELTIPVIGPSARGSSSNRLEVSLAGRLDHYSDVGSTFNPKLGAAFRPIEGLRIRGTFGTSFRAPTQYNLFGPIAAFLRTRADPQSPTGQSTVLEISGGNPDLKPEKARIWTAGFDYQPSFIEGFKITATYFDYRFKDKVASPIANSSLELIDSIYTPFVLRNLSAAEVAEYLARAAFFINGADPGESIATTSIVVDSLNRNLDLLTARGVDFGADWRVETASGGLTLGANMTWLTQRQTTLTSAGSRETSGLTFGPAKFKARGNASWDIGAWTLGAALNHVAGSTDFGTNPVNRVGSFTTADAQIAYRPTWLQRARLSATVLNLFDTSPPRVDPNSTLILPGLGYDPANASPIGRQINFSLTLGW